MKKALKDQKIRELMPELIASMEQDDKETGLAIFGELTARFLDNQERQTLALESIAKTIAEQTKLMKGGK